MQRPHAAAPFFLASTALLAGAFQSPPPSAASRAQSQPADEPRFTPPPPDVPPQEIATKLKEAAEALLEKRLDVDALLVDPARMPLHEWTAFRELVRNHAPLARVAIAGAAEPGTRLVVRGVVRDKAGRPVESALVYAYHTSAKGWYSDKAPHISGDSGDHKHARLFGYVRTGADGAFELRTIRPAGYPRSDLPAHVHLFLSTNDGRQLGTEVQFDDDPRLTPEERVKSLRNGFVVVRVEKAADGSQRCEAAFALPERRG